MEYFDPLEMLQNFSFPISFSLDSFMNLVFFAITFFVIILSCVLTFHWQRYGLSKTIFVITELVYLFGCILLLSAAFIALN